MSILYWFITCCMSMGLGASIYRHEWSGSVFLSLMIMQYVAAILRIAESREE